jgi:hypothetical protein
MCGSLSAYLRLCYAAGTIDCCLGQYYEIAHALHTCKVGWPRRNSMAKCLYLTSDGQVCWLSTASVAEFQFRRPVQSK